MAKRKSEPIGHPEIVQRFAARLRELRVSRGMTQKDLAQRAGLTDTYISRLEAAGAAPGIDLIARLADALGSTVPDLLSVADQPNPRAVLVTQAKRLFDRVTETATEASLSHLNQFLAMMSALASDSGDGGNTRPKK